LIQLENAKDYTTLSNLILANTKTEITFTLRQKSIGKEINPIRANIEKILLNALKDTHAPNNESEVETFLNNLSPSQDLLAQINKFLHNHKTSIENIKAVNTQIGDKISEKNDKTIDSLQDISPNTKKEVQKIEHTQNEQNKQITKELSPKAFLEYVQS
jgi:hypothetical protein